MEGHGKGVFSPSAPGKGLLRAEIAANQIIRSFPSEGQRAAVIRFEAPVVIRKRFSP